jgi:hypothetical protein
MPEDQAAQDGNMFTRFKPNPAPKQNTKKPVTSRGLLQAAMKRGRGNVRI